ncbi:MAG: TonB-dependent receptor domain-containing protein [Gemmatimonadaceae bacterium]
MLATMRTVVSRSRMLLLGLAFLGAGASAARAQGGVIGGRLTDAESGNGVASARVEALAADGTVAATAVSDEQGTYRLASLSPGSYTLRITRLGYAPRRIADVRVGGGGGGPVVLAVVLTSVATQLNPSVVTASRRQEKALEAPAAVAVVSTQDVEERAALTSTDHIRAVPGVDVVQSGLLAANVVARGFNNAFSGAMLTLTDNRYAAVPSLRVNIPYLPATTNDDIERIEVVLGPGAALYGPNSANGVLHVITRSPFDSRGTTVSVFGGNQSVAGAAARVATTVGERFAFKVSGQYMQGEDWQFIDDVERINRQAAITAGANPATLLIGARDFDVERWTGELRGDLRPTDDSELIFTYGITNAGSAIELTGAGTGQVKDWTYEYYQLRGRAGRLFGQVYLNESDAGDTYLLRTGQPIIDNSTVLVGQLQHGLDLGTRQSFIYGVDYQETDPKTEGTINGRNEDDDDITEVGGYVQSETSLSPQFDFIAALRVDDHSRLEDVVWSPRAALVFKPSDTQNWRLTYNRAFSTPTTNNLFLDLLAGSLRPLAPYDVRALGVPSGGFRFRRDCAGTLCMRSPFLPTNDFIPSSVTAYWPIVRGVLAQAGVPNANVLPAPTPQQVGTVLRVLNPTNRQFTEVSPEDVRDIDDIRPTINNTVELGYKGLLADRLLLAVSVYREWKKNFVGPLIVESPNVFINGPQLAAYLVTLGFPPAQAGAIAGGVAMLPLGTVVPDSRLTSTPDLFLTYRNFGDVDYWGGDLSVEALLTSRFSVSGSYSYVSKDFFPREEVGGLSDVALNAPANKATLGGRYRDEGSGIAVELRARYVDAFPVNSGVYVGTVDSYTLLDANFSYRVPFAPGVQLSVTAQNILDEKHRQFVGVPELGALVLTRLSYTFR